MSEDNLYEVPEEKRLDQDPPPQYNADAGFDVEMVPDGEYAELSTADESEPVAGEGDEVDEGDGSPLELIDPLDPDHDLDDDEVDEDELDDDEEGE
jgi:hypothetical protein